MFDSCSIPVQVRVKIVKSSNLQGLKSPSPRSSALAKSAPTKCISSSSLCTVVVLRPVLDIFLFNLKTSSGKNGFTVALIFLSSWYAPSLSSASSTHQQFSGQLVMSSIPLSCQICPKQPTFSDVSHMLTHVGSKGHLSHYFKAQVRSRQEPSMREQLIAYDAWYKENHVEKLLSRRMVLRDSKQQDPRRKVDPSKIEDSYNDSAIFTANVPQNQVKEEAIDPRLSRHLFVPSIPDLEASGPYPYPSALTHSPWVQDEYEASGQYGRLVQLGLTFLAPLEESDDEPLILGYTRRCTDIIHAPSTMVESRSSPSSSLTMFERPPPKVLEPIKLKGVIWPGMQIFDAASPEAQRMRNQKKIRSITETMRANSEIVEQTERIYWPGGELKRERFITGEVSSSSPAPETPPKPKQTRRRVGRAPLTALNTNSARIQDESPARKSLSRLAKAASNIQRRTRDSARESARAPTRAPARAPTIRSSRRMTGPKVEPRKSLGLREPGNTGCNLHDGHLQTRNPRLGVYRDRVPTEPVRTDSHPSEIFYGQDFPFLQTASFSKSSNTRLPFLNQEYPSQQALAFNSPLHQTPQSPQAYSRTELNRSYDSSHPFIATKESDSRRPLMSLTGRMTVPGATFAPGPQRYFVQQDDEPPTFYSTMPAQVDFTTFHRSPIMAHALNPLIFSFETTEPQTPEGGLNAEKSNAGESSKRTGEMPGVGVYLEDSGDETVDDTDANEDMFAGNDT